MSNPSCARCKDNAILYIHSILLLLCLLLLTNILVQFGKKLIHPNPIEHLLDLAHLPPALVKPYKRGMLVLVRSDRRVRLCQGIDDSFAVSGVVDDIVNGELLPFLESENSILVLLRFLLVHNRGA